MKSTVRRSLSVGALLISVLLVQPNIPIFLTSVAEAQASVSVSIDFGTFYGGLSSYGTWTSLNDQYVWVPNDIDTNWRPYSRGHWVATEDYGWIWVSDEPFGWATYHYGRWGYDDAIGWYWVPGHRWAPAWVAWSRNDDDVAWAPLPPPPTNDRDNVSINISVGDVPDYYWEAVPATAFLSINFSNDFIRDRNKVHDVVQSSQPRTVVIQNNIVINNAIDPAFIEQRTGRKVDRAKIEVAASPDQIPKAGATKSDTVTIFNGQVKGQADVKPQAVQPPDQIANDRKAKGIQPLDKASQEQGGTAAKQQNNNPPPAPANNNTTAVTKQNNGTDAKTPTNETPKADQTTSTTDQNATPPTPQMQPGAKQMGKIPPTPADKNVGGGTANQIQPTPNKQVPTDTNSQDSKVKPNPLSPPTAPLPDAKAKVPVAPSPTPQKLEQNKAVQKIPNATPPAPPLPKAAPQVAPPQIAAPPKAAPPPVPEPPKVEAPQPPADAKTPEKPKAACDPKTQGCN